MSASPLLFEGARAPVIAVATASGATAGIAVGMQRGGPEEAVAMGLFCAALAAASVVDLRERRIPNAVTYPGIVLALLFSLIVGGAADALAGFAFAGGTLGVFWVVGRGQLGMGDVKLGAFIGAAVGIQGVPTFLVVGTLGGAAFGLVILLVRRDRRATLPYGPWLALGGAAAAVLGGTVVT